jgi:hypothetical protein
MYVYIYIIYTYICTDIHICYLLKGGLTPPPFPPSGIDHGYDYGYGYGSYLHSRDFGSEQLFAIDPHVLRALGQRGVHIRLTAELHSRPNAVPDLQKVLYPL